MCKLLDSYATAAVNLYGLIRRDEFVEIFNAQNEEQTTVDEVYTILLPYVLKDGKYWFYRSHIVHSFFLRDPDHVEIVKKAQGDKQRYIPPKEQFLRFESEEYDDNSHLEDVREFLCFLFGYEKGVAAMDDFARIKHVSQMYVLDEMSAIMERHELIFDGKKQFQKFFDLFKLAANNSRIWENKGHTPIEMEKLLASRRSKDPIFLTSKKILPNQPCPCRSGKKYKKCCALVKSSGEAQISLSERKLFYDTWYKLLDFVNQKLHVVHAKFSWKYPDYHDDALLLKIREKLWANPKLIDEFLRSANTLCDEEISLLQAWEKHHVKGKFILLKCEPEYAVFMRVADDPDVKLYGVKGMKTSVAETVPLQLPIVLETVLLPFRDKIIYDTFLGAHAIEFDDEFREMIDDEYSSLMEKHGIILKLGEFSTES